jgi:hypothetical protein
MSNKNFQSEENEILSADEAKVRELLGSLQRVDAPKDFDFRLKARIAGSEAKDFQPRLFPILRYAAPLGLAIIILAVIVVNGLYSVDDNSIQVAEKSVQNQTKSVNAPDNSTPKDTLIAETTPQTIVAENLTANPPTITNKKDTKTFSKDFELASNSGKLKNDKPQAENNGGSRDSALSNTNVLMPKGFGGNNSVPVKDVLEIIGIKAKFSGNQWKVESVGENTVAGNSGVKPNDVIEAIDGKNLSGETIPAAKTFSGKLTVMRGGEKLEIKLLQNK